MQTGAVAERGERDERGFAGDARDAQGVRGGEGKARGADEAEVRRGSPVAQVATRLASESETRFLPLVSL